MLSDRYPLETLREILLPRDAFNPFPAATDRDPWDSIPESIKRAHLARGESALGFEYPALSATLFLEFARNGNRTRYQDPRNARRNALADLVIAECLENQGRFVDDIVNGIWCTCEETYWGVPAHMYIQKGGPGLPNIEEPTVDLFAAETVALLAWTLYLLGHKLDEVSPLIRHRIIHETQWRILEPCLRRDDFWWMGYGIHPVLGKTCVNNWNPWINSNRLTAALLLEEDADKRVTHVDRILRSLDVFIDHYSDDGGCDEGPGYWGRAGASVFDNLEILDWATGGKIDLWNEPKIQNMARFIYRAQIDGHYFVNFADASGWVTPSASLAYRFGQRIADPAMSAIGAWAAQESKIRENGFTDSLSRKLPALFSADGLLSSEPGFALPRDVYLPGIQFVASRDSEGSSEGFYLAAKGGHNAESHNHNDIGTFIVYTDGKPALIDIGVETYTAKTFSPKRYEIWTMQSGFHNLPTVNGCDQLQGDDRKASDVIHESDDTRTRFSLDIAAAYPQEAKLESWKRSIVHDRASSVTIEDTYSVSEIAGDFIFNFITPCDVTIQDGTATLASRKFREDRDSGSATLHFDLDQFEATSETIPVEDDRLVSVWGTQLNRIRLKLRQPKKSDVISIRITR
jgi:hypothetical protein